MPMYSATPMLSLLDKRSAAVLCLAFPGLAVAGNSAGLPADTYRTTVSEVRITFFATDQNNRPVQNIGRDDFAVVDNGIVVRDFRSLMRSDETELDLVGLIDASESVADRLPRTSGEVLQLVSQRQLAGDDNLSIVAFSGLEPVLICNQNCRDESAEQKLRSVHASGTTPLYDALARSADLIAARRAPGVRPVLVLFSDGEDNISKVSAQDAIDAVVASGAVLYAVDLNENDDQNGSAVLQRMAAATGGRAFSIHNGAVNVVETALEDLRASYIVTYQLPSRAAGFHSLRILPKHDLNLRFHCRNGYNYGTNIP